MGVSTAHKHVHDQPVAATEWNVIHNLNTDAPIVDVIVHVGETTQKMLPLDIVVVDSSTVKITFSSPRSGKASVV